jgi:pimeloyl-ACP methyl ester carboxylesterase
MTAASAVTERVRGPLLDGFQVAEAGAGRPVVLLHGFPSDGRIFARQLAAARSGELAARVLAVDLPGFGRTPAPAPPIDVLEVPVLVDSLAAWLETAGIERPVIGGLAIGAYLAIELAAIHPDRVAGLVLIGAKPEPDAAANADRREAVARLALDGGARAVAESLVDEPFSSRTGVNARRRFRRMIEDADPAAIAALVRGLHRRPDPKPALAAISRRRLPALVLIGADDPFTRPADARRLADLLPNSSFEVLSGAGHLPPLERPAAVNRALRRFLDALPEQAAR